MIIEARGLTRTYPMGSAEVRALRSVDLCVEEGEFVALTGASGSGKSTLLHLLGCLDRPTSGAYLLEGRDVSRLTPDQRALVRNTSIGFVFQTFNLLPDITALENITLPLLYRRSTADARRSAAVALSSVGLAKRAGHRPSQLSGGERQRVAIAGALVASPALLLADEPTGNLDTETGREILALLVDLNRRGRTILMVTHDPAIAAYAGRRVHMQDGQIVAQQILPQQVLPSRVLSQQGLTPQVLAEGER
jgi:putative ABC transport system ATP-binding protein